MPQSPPYQRLTFARSRSVLQLLFANRSSLWLGPDHLLGVDSNGYTETYKRFYFRDIQAVWIQETRKRAVVNGLLAWFVCLSVVCALFVVGTSGVRIAWLSGAALLVCWMLLNTLSGPTCRCFLRTAVQIEELPSLNRLRRAHKVLNRLRPLIVSAQGGELSPETVSARMREAYQSAVPAGPSESATAFPNAPPVIS